MLLAFVLDLSVSGSWSESSTLLGLYPEARIASVLVLVSRLNTTRISPPRPHPHSEPLTRLFSLDDLLNDVLNDRNADV